MNQYYRITEKLPEHDSYIFVYDADNDEEFLIRYMGSMQNVDNPGKFPLWRYAEIGKD